MPWHGELPVCTSIAICLKVKTRTDAWLNFICSDKTIQLHGTDVRKIQLFCGFNG